MNEGEQEQKCPNCDNVVEHKGEHVMRVGQDFSDWCCEKPKKLSVTLSYPYGDSRCTNREDCIIENRNLDFVCVGVEKCPNSHKKQPSMNDIHQHEMKIFDSYVDYDESGYKIKKVITVEDSNAKLDEIYEDLKFDDEGNEGFLWEYVGDYGDLSGHLDIAGLKACFERFIEQRLKIKVAE